MRLQDMGGEVIGLLPCAGHANRLAPLPCSKEVLPVALSDQGDQASAGAPRVKVVSHFLLDKMRDGGVRKAYAILRRGKWDIPDYYGDGGVAGVDLGYLIVHRPFGPPYTLDQAYPFVRGARIALGFPDILFGPKDAYAQALARLAVTRAAIVLGLYYPHDIRSCDMTGVDESGRVRELVLKPHETTLQWTWIFAVWAPEFTEFLHHYLKVPRTAPQQADGALPPELTVGHVFQAAIVAGLDVQTVAFPAHRYVDIGTPQGLREAVTGIRPHEFGMDDTASADGASWTPPHSQPSVV
jgi:glucose-1-phosphate thymidylyltransferase